MLSRNFESELALRILTPTNWFRLPSGTFGKSDLFAELYDETVFDHATFGDLKRANGPFVIINGTDVTTGARFSFTQDQFDAICGDLSQVTLGRAVATSTALPPLLTPITLENRGGTCGRKAPAWQDAAEAAVGESETPGRALLRARALQSYQDPARPYVHLFDGGLSENLGLSRGAQGLRDSEGRAGRDGAGRAPPGPHSGGHRRERAALPRGGLGPLRRAAGHRHAEGPDVVDPGRPDLARRGGAGAREAGRLAGCARPERRAYLAQVTFDSLKDPAERLYFKRVKTSLALPKEQVDRLREVAGRLLREAPAFRRLLADLESE